MALFLDVAVGDVLSIDNGKVQITIIDKSGSRSRLSVEADKSIKIEKVQKYSVDGNKNIAGNGLTKR